MVNSSDDSKFEKWSTRIGWVYAIALVLGYFVVINSPLFPRYVTARRIIWSLGEKDVSKGYLLALSEHEQNGRLIENALLLEEFKTNTWRLVHAKRYEEERGWSPWYPFVVHDSNPGWWSYTNRPTESDVEAFLTTTGWFFESARETRFNKGEIFTNTWQKALGYIPTHPWTRPTEARSQASLEIIMLLNQFCTSTDPDEQLHLIRKFVSLPRQQPSRTERIPRPRFVGVMKDKLEFTWNAPDLDRIKSLLVFDDSGEPPLFEGGVVEIESKEVLKHIHDWVVRERYGY